MELHKALRNIIQTEGRDILKEVRVMYILDDYGIFRNKSGLKNIFRSIIVDGFSEKLLKLSIWDDSINKWAFELSQKRGYNAIWTNELLNQIAISLGIVHSNENSLNIDEPELEFVYKPKVDSSEYETIFRNNLDCLNAVEEGKRIGIEIKNIKIQVKQYDVEYDVQHSYGYLSISLELFRIEKLKRIRKLWIAVYDKRENILKKMSIGEMRNDDSQLKPCMRSVGIELKEVKKIVLFWS